MQLKPPCTKDCPRRCPACGSTCKEWKDYLVERQKVYDLRKARSTAYYAISSEERKKNSGKKIR